MQYELSELFDIPRTPAPMMRTIVRKSLLLKVPVVTEMFTGRHTLRGKGQGRHKGPDSELGL